MGGNSKTIASIRLGKGTFSLESGEQVAKNGLPYFDFRYTEGERYTALRVWVNELLWAVQAIARIAEAAPYPEPPSEGTYSLASLMSAAGGPGLALSFYEGRFTFVMRRYKSNWTPRGNSESQFTRFFVHDRFQLKAPWKPKQLAEFAAQASMWLTDFAAQAVETSGMKVPEALKAYDRIVVTGAYGGAVRRMLLAPGMELSGAEFDLLPDDGLALILKACSAPVATEAIPGLLHNAIDVSAVKQSISWPRRYSRDVLKQAFVLNSHDAKRFSAARSAESFASDPLLTCLDVGIKARAQKHKLASVPQCSDAMLKAVLAKGNCLGVAESRFGEVPVPTPLKKAEISKLLTPASGLGIQRWKIVQLMELESAAALNAPAKDEATQLLDYQRIKLMAGDVKRLFADGPGQVEPYLQAAAERASAILQGQGALTPYLAMPKREQEA